MYPRLSDLLRDLFGVELPLPIYSFGAMVAVAILTAAALTRRELDRMYAAGQLPAVRLKVRDPKGREKTEDASPSSLTWTLMLMAAFVGIAGSKLFHVIDYWDRFVLNPVGFLFSPSGLTFWGGLICAGLAIAWYVRKKGLPVPRTADAIAPSLILGYGIGRIGCYLAGDGDWGVCSDPADKPAWVPTFLWTEDFGRNILNVDLAAQCPGGGVFPTMLYETALATLIFGGLWALRRHPFRAGWIFSLYLVLAAAQRFVIELIRVNRDVAGELSQAQVISIGLFVLGLVGLALTTRRVRGDAPADPAPAREPAVAQP